MGPAEGKLNFLNTERVKRHLLKLKQVRWFSLKMLCHMGNGNILGYDRAGIKESEEEVADDVYKNEPDVLKFFRKVSDSGQTKKSGLYKR